VVLGPADRLVGQLYIEGDLRVSGTVDGAIEATGDIVISDRGKVNGSVTAYNRLVVGGQASLEGSDVRVGRLTVEDGATFSGHVTMGKAAMKAAKAVEAPRPMVESLPELPAPAETPPVEAPPAEVVAAETVKPQPGQQKGRRR
jgi:cytoskeletal protein CcmA (bactofilin family)